MQAAAIMCRPPLPDLAENQTTSILALDAALSARLGESHVTSAFVFYSYAFWRETG